MESFRRQADAQLAQARRVEHRWIDGHDGYLHLEVPPESPHGFFVTANVGPEYAFVLAGVSLSRQFPVATPEEEALAEDRARAIVVFVSKLLGPEMRVRERRAGRSTFNWLLEERATGGWRAIARFWSPIPWHYLGARCEVIYQNRQLRDVESRVAAV